MRTNQAPQLYGIIGTSLKHTLSPSIYDFLSKRHAINGSYSVFEIAENNLDMAIKAVRVIGIKGLNVTYPFKEMILRHLDKLDKSADDIGAVNTIKNVNGVLTGYNTDRAGIEATFSNRLSISPRGKNILLIGAGGAARACLGAFMKSRPKTIVITNRTPATARKIIKQFGSKFGKTQLIASNLNEMTEFKGKFDIIVNAITADMNFTGKLLRLLNKRNLLDGTRFFDLNYGKRALSDGLPEGISRRTDGLYMLAVQAAASFKIWHNMKVNINELFDILNDGQ